MGEGGCGNGFDVCVIGGGPAGVTAALRARELGATVALVERGQFGGTCTNDGCVPTRAYWLARRGSWPTRGQYADYGITLPAPELDFPRLLERAQGIVYEMHEKKQLIAHLEASGVTVFAPAGPRAFSTRIPFSWARAHGGSRRRSSSSAPADARGASTSPARNWP